MATASSVRVRMYRLDELGDCFLLTFNSGDAASNLLIDCGTFRNGAASVKRLKAIAADIASTTGNSGLDVVVGTHQHNDHVNGFVHCESEFKDIGVGKVWLSWLDDPTDETARKIGDDHQNLRMALYGIRKKILASGAFGKAPALETIDGLLAFFGASRNAAPDLPAQGINILKSLGKAQPDYLRPGQTLDLPGLPAGAVKVHVLGPPVNRDQLYRKDPKKGESYDKQLAAATISANKLLDALDASGGKASRSEKNYPFNETYKKRETARSLASLAEVVSAYRRRNEAWRTIDDDWLDQAEALALYLDSFTNNSSLVLAIELCDSKKILLFAADAQTGNWASWDGIKWKDHTVDTDSLLARTVLYKVGHHGSHNATLVGMFEKMTNPNLVALIPVHKQDPNITGDRAWKMPAKNLFKRIAEKTSNRVLQMDNDNPARCNPKTQPAKAAWKKAGIEPRITDMFIELDIKP